MSGHSKWSTIKHKKAAADAKRGKAFTQVAKEITIAAREGGGDPTANTRLRLAMDKARSVNMPKDNVERAIKRGTGEIEGLELTESVYEGYAPHGIGLIIEVVTDNRNRAIADIRHALNKYGGNMAEAGAVSWQFTRKGYINIIQEVDQDELFMVAADAGADDIQFGESVEIFVDLENFHGVRLALEEAGYEFEEASVIYNPNNPVALWPEETVQVLNFIEKVEDLDDVQSVASNLQITDEIIEAFETV